MSSNSQVAGASQRPRPRFTRFSLRTAFILMTVLCVWIGMAYQRAAQRQRAIDELHKFGGEFDVPAERINQILVAMGGKPHPISDPVLAAWLRPVVGDFRPMSPLALAFRAQGWQDAQHLARLHDIPDLEELTLFAVRLRNGDAQHFRGLSNLRTLLLTACYSRGDDEPLTDFTFLASLRRVENIALRKSNFGDDDVAHLRGLKNLKILQLGSTKLTDAGLVEIGRLAQLETLFIPDTAITDEGLKSLQVLTNLRWLDVSGTAVTDAGLGYLSALGNLRTLAVQRTQVTPAGIALLKRALPQCTVNP